MVTHYVVNCILISNDKILLEYSAGGTFWKLPGGHIEPEETPLETLERECLEELGSKIVYISIPNAFTTNSIAQSLPIPFNIYMYNVKADSHYEGDHRHLGFVYVIKPTSEPKNLEHQQLKWFSRNDLKEKDLNVVVKELCLKALEKFSTV